MKQRTTELLKKIDEKHDWREGQTYGGQGDVYTSTDECRICGLIRHWTSGSNQNDISPLTSFRLASGASVPLREAAELDC